MLTNFQGAADRERDLDQILGAYFDAVEAGDPLSRRQLLEQHPGLAGDISEFFAKQDELDGLIGQFRLAASSNWTAVSEPFGAVAPKTSWRDAPPEDVDAPAWVPVPPAETAAPARADGDSESPSHPTSPAEGVRFGDYRLLEKVAEGATGVIFRALQLRTGRTVALKLIHPNSFAARAEVDRFHVDTGLLAQLHHPNIVPVYDCGECFGYRFYSMEPFCGGDVAALLAAGPVDPSEAARLTIMIAQAVHYAHQHGILHRNLKPSNVLLDSHGRPHVGDFALAKRPENWGDPDDEDREAERTRVGKLDTPFPGRSRSFGLAGSAGILGTPAFLAPEQARSPREPITTATDIYGIGATLYALLTGCPPFQGTVREVLAKIRDEEPETPLSQNTRVDEDLGAVCLKCLAKNPADRYSSAADLVLDLERWIRREPVTARRRRYLDGLVLWARRRLAIAALAAAIIAVLAVGLGAVGWQNRQVLASPWTQSPVHSSRDPSKDDVHHPSKRILVPRRSIRGLG